MGAKACETVFPCVSPILKKYLAIRNRGYTDKATSAGYLSVPLCGLGLYRLLAVKPVGLSS